MIDCAKYIKSITFNYLSNTVPYNTHTHIYILTIKSYTLRFDTPLKKKRHSAQHCRPHLNTTAFPGATFGRSLRARRQLDRISFHCVPNGRKTQITVTIERYCANTEGACPLRRRYYCTMSDEFHRAPRYRRSLTWRTKNGEIRKPSTIDARNSAETSARQQLRGCRENRRKENPPYCDPAVMSTTAFVENEIRDRWKRVYGTRLHAGEFVLESVEVSRTFGNPYVAYVAV